MFPSLSHHVARRAHRRAWIGALLCCLLVGWSQGARAFVIAEYGAGSGPSTSSPDDWEWQLNYVPIGAPSNFVVAPVQNDLASGRNAWQIDDSAAVANQPQYTLCIDACFGGPAHDAALQLGWRFSTTARYLDDFSTTANGAGNMGLAVWIDGAGYYGMLDLLSNDLRSVLYQGPLLTKYTTLTTGGTGRAAYHNFALVYNAVSHLVSFEFDGRIVDTTVAQLSAGHPNTMSWGNVGPDRGKMNFRSAEFRITLPGDYNLDNVVDAADYTVWRNRFNTPYGPADGDGSGTVGAADYAIWRTNYGTSHLFGSGGSANVPEPRAFAHLFLATIGVFVLFPRRFVATPLATGGSPLEFGHGRVR